jgi:hypothetical protein
MRVISDRGKKFSIVKIMGIETGNECDIRQEMGVLCYQQHIN